MQTTSRETIHINALHYIIEQFRRLKCLLFYSFTGTKRQKESINTEDKTLILISQNVSDYSRQRMRALQMSLRHYSNVDGRVTAKELNLAYQVCIIY